MSSQYEVLSPWAGVDSIPLKGISPRLNELEGKNIGLFATVYKKASRPMLAAAAKKLKERFPTLGFSWFEHPFNLVIADMERASDSHYITPEFKLQFEDWVKGVDAVAAAVGD